MPDNWKPIVLGLIYGLEYENDLPTRAQRMFEGIAAAPDQARATPEQVRAAIEQALSSPADLPKEYVIAGKVVAQPYSDADVRGVLAELAEKLRLRLAQSGDPAPLAGRWVPATFDEHTGVGLAAGDRLPAHDGGSWWRFVPDAADGGLRGG